MQVSAQKVMCTGKPAPREWNMEGRSGVSYKVDLSDGYESISVPCKDAEVYGAFLPFQAYQVDFEVVSTVNNNRQGVRIRAINAVPVS